MPQHNKNTSGADGTEVRDSFGQFKKFLPSENISVSQSQALKEGIFIAS
jgi:hypothetical protein